MSEKESEEDKFVAAAGAGDRDAFGELVERHFGRLFRTTRRITRHREDAEDVVAGGNTSTDLASFWQSARVANCGAVALWRGRSSSGPQESAFSVRARSRSNSFVCSSAARAAPCIFLATESTVP